MREDFFIHKEPEVVAVVSEEEGTKALSSPAEGCPDGKEGEEASEVLDVLLSSESRLIVTGEGEGGSREAESGKKVMEDRNFKQDVISLAKKVAPIGKESATLSLNVNYSYHALNACNDASESHVESDFEGVGSNVNDSDNYVVETTSSFKRVSSNSGPVEIFELIKGPLFFDSACRNFHHSKSKRVTTKL